SQELQAPIAEKMRKAIQEVGEENGLIYIYDASNPAFLYISSKSIDVMSMVKKKLGIN
ncbi:MAG: OmpH family outer membrane protein, partial [Bacteroidales bacterium]